MVWFKVDDSLALHPKALSAGNAAMGLWVRAGAWSSQQLTGGYIPSGVVTMLGGRSRDADSLVRVGLWIEAVDGYQFHQWDERQPTKDSVESDREAARERQRRARERARAARETQESRVSHGVTSPEVHPVVTVPPTRPDPTRPTTEELPSDKPKAKARRRGVVGFELSDGMKAWAASNEPAVDVERETAKFVDHFTGTGDVKSDWTATWRNWIRRAAEQRQPVGVPQQRALRAVGQSTTDQRVEAGLALARRYAEEDET